MGKILNKVTQGLGIAADPNAGAASMAQAMEMQRQALEEIKKVAPSDYAKLEDLARKAAAVAPEYVGDLDPQELDVEDILSVYNSPFMQKLQQTEGDIEGELDKIIEAGGLTEEMKADFNKFQDEQAARSQAQQKQITQQEMMQGRSGSGVELAQKIQAQQSDAQRRAQAAQQLAASAQNSKMGALQSKQQLTGQQAQRAIQQGDAKSTIAQFGALNRMRADQFNLGRRQSLADQEAAQQRQLYGQLGNIEGLKRSEAMERASGVSRGMQNYGNQLMAQAGREAQSAQAQAAANMGLLTAGVQAYAASDEKGKKEVKEPSVDEIKDMLKKIEAFTYKYKDPSNGEGKQMGVMAQDLEKSKLGSEFVEDTSQGKVVNYGKMASTMAASLANLSDRLERLESAKSQKMADGGIRNRYSEGLTDAQIAGRRAENEYDDLQKYGSRYKAAMYGDRNRGMTTEQIGGNLIDKVKGMFSGDSEPKLKDETELFGKSAFDDEQNRKILKEDLGVKEVNGESLGSSKGQKIAGAVAEALSPMTKAPPVPMQQAPQVDLGMQRMAVNNPLQEMTQPQMTPAFADGGVRRPEEVMADIQNLMQSEFAKGGVKYEDGGYDSPREDKIMREQWRYHLKENEQDEIKKKLMSLYNRIQTPDTMPKSLQEEYINDLKKEMEDIYNQNPEYRKESVESYYPEDSYERYKKDELKGREKIDWASKKGVIWNPKEHEQEFEDYYSSKYPEKEGTDFSYQKREDLEKKLDSLRDSYNEGGISPELREASQMLRQASQPAPNAPMPGGQPPMPPAPQMPPMAPQGAPMPPQGMPPQGQPPMPPMPQGQMMADGGMAYEDGGEGTIIPGESYEGDELPDRINSGEMVLNVEQQDRLNDALMELKRLKSKERTDKMLADGEAEVNPMQQESLMAFVRGEIDVDELPNERVVKEPTIGEPSGNMAKLLSMVSRKRRG